MNNPTENSQRSAAKIYADHVTVLELRILRPHIAARVMSGMRLTYCQKMIVRKWAHELGLSQQECLEGIVQECAPEILAKVAKWQSSPRELREV